MKRIGIQNQVGNDTINQSTGYKLITISELYKVITYCIIVPNIPARIVKMKRKNIHILASKESCNELDI